MHIESPEELKEYLTKELDLISDNSKDLAPYVMALVKKSMPVDALRAHCADQLEVFLEEKTNSFLDRLFSHLENQGAAAPVSDTPLVYPKSSPPPPPQASTKQQSPPRETRESSNNSRERDSRRESHSSREDRRREYRRDALDDEDRDYRRRGRSSPDLREDSHRKRYRDDDRGRYRDRDAQREPRDAHSHRDFEDRHPRRKEPCIDFETKGKCFRGDECPYDHGSNPIVVPPPVIPAEIPEQRFPDVRPPGNSIGTPFDAPSRRPAVQQRLGFSERPGPGFAESYNPDKPFDNFRLPPHLQQNHPPPGPHSQQGPHPHGPGHHQHQQMPPPHMLQGPPPPLGWRPMMDMRSVHPMDLRMLPPPGFGPHGMMPMMPPRPSRPMAMQDEVPHGALLPSPMAPPQSHQPPSLPPPPLQAHMPHQAPQHMQQQPHLPPHTMPGANAQTMQQLPPPAGQPAAEKRRFCFQFSKGDCHRGASCKFSHDPADAGASKPRSKAAIKRGCRLEVRGIPEDLNNIPKLNEHFAKFGAIVNLHVGVLGSGVKDGRAAVVEFRSALDATKAHNSEDAVFGNRFIRVLWPQDVPAPPSTGAAPTGPAVPVPAAKQPSSELSVAPTAAAAVTESPSAHQALSAAAGVQVVVVSASAPNALQAPTAASASTPAPQTPSAPSQVPPTLPAAPKATISNAAPATRVSAGSVSARKPASAPSTSELDRQRELVAHLIQQQKAMVEQLAASKTLSVADRRKAKDAVKSTMVLVESATASLRALAARKR